MSGFSSDIRYALRTIRHGGISTAVAVLSLAVGVEANAAIFSVGHAMLARPLPYAGGDRLVMLRSTNPSHGVLWTTAAAANLLDWQAQAKSFEAIAGYRWRSVDLTGGDHSERLRGLFITPEFFKVLDVPLMGKPFEVEALNPANPRQRRHEIARLVQSGSASRCDPEQGDIPTFFGNQRFAMHRSRSLSSCRRSRAAFDTLEGVGFSTAVL